MVVSEQKYFQDQDDYKNGCKFQTRNCLWGAYFNPANQNASLRFQHLVSKYFLDRDCLLLQSFMINSFQSNPYPNTQGIPQGCCSCEYINNRMLKFSLKKCSRFNFFFFF